jgi:hypothetical protein
LLNLLFGLRVDFGDNGNDIDFFGYDAHVFDVEGFQTVDEQVEADIYELVGSYAYSVISLILVRKGAKGGVSECAKNNV